MQLRTATKIEACIGTGEAYEPSETLLQQVENLTAEEMRRPKFEPYKGKIRHSGTGGIYELNDHLFEGRYSPTNTQGKRGDHAVYPTSAKSGKNSTGIKVETADTRQVEELNKGNKTPEESNGKKTEKVEKKIAVKG